MSRYPKDWPVSGEIDLHEHDAPHRSSATEWWYMNTHLQTADKRSVSLFAAFFRIIKGRNAETQLPEYAHSVTWGLSDLDTRSYVAESRVDKSAPKMGIERINKGRGSRDPRLNRAILELLENDRVPAPDRMFEHEPFVATDRLELDYDGARFTKLDDGRYRLQLSSERGGCDLVFTPKKPPHRHGDDGVARGPAGEELFYYFIPRCAVSGTVTLGGVEIPASGDGWYDHEFGGHKPEGEQNEEAARDERQDIAWNWTAVQLADGRDLTAYSLVRMKDNHIIYRWAVLSDASGKQRSFTDMTMTPGRMWRSTRTFNDYPVSWTLSIPSAKLELQLDASFDDQEIITLVSKPAFWEGRIDARGTIDGREVTGRGYVERSGFEPVKNLDEFFTAVGHEVRKSVAQAVPAHPTFEQARELVATKERPHYLDGMDLEQLGNALLRPIRDITDRGGKSWRSYGMLACIDVVGGDSRKFVHWLALPELIHVGSLIVDDVQDRSTVRRGGPAAHITYGEPRAINSGTAAYFLVQKLLAAVPISPARKLRNYDLYFEAMCAGHAGQAIDLDGLHAALDRAADTGDAESLEKSVLNVHLLKAGVPASSLARIGAVAGGGSEAQIEAVGHFFEQVGLAFQIVDDVLNLRGFKDDLKSRGEDIMNGVVTLPVAKAMSRMTRAERLELAAIIKSKPQDLRVVSAVVEKLETSGAIQACADQASAVVEQAWQRAEPHLPDTIYKILLRSFGWYVLERHY